MKRAILSLCGVLTAAIALTGCAASGGGSASGTTGSVASMHHAQGAGNLRASVHGFEAQLQTSVHAFQSGNLAKAIASGGPLLNDCAGTVDKKIAPDVSTPAEKPVLPHLRSACIEMSRAANAGASGNLKRARQFARDALMQARLAARLAR